MFKITKQSRISKARLGKLTTSHGVIDAPFFMPDATKGAVKSLSGGDLKILGLEALVVNTYHLYLQPGMSLVKKAGGIHRFMDWSGPLLSDSGGYQVFSLIHKNKSFWSESRRRRDEAIESITEKQMDAIAPLTRGSSMTESITDSGVIFRSPLDGAKHDLTPEKSIQIQFDLGVDMMVCLDDCPPNDAPSSVMNDAVRRTIFWAERCKIEFEKQMKKRKLKKVPLLFGVIQGGLNLELRRQCAKALLAIGFSGYGFGARHVDGEGKFLSKQLSFTADLIPEDKIRFGLGIGTPDDIVRAVKMGWDMFDCVIPTREARHGKLYVEADRRGTKRGYTRNLSDAVRVNPRKYPRVSASINITNARFKKDFTPISPNSRLSELRHYTRAYLHHLFKTQEPLALRLATLNNLEFYQNLMGRIQKEIRAGKI